MSEIYTAKEMNQLDAYAIDTLEIPQSTLMEHAALEVAKCILERFPKIRSALIFCGSGNNGGDGIALARLLTENGIDTKVYPAKDITLCKPSVIEQANRYQKAGGEFLKQIPDEKFDVIVDALFGIGLNTEPKANYAELIRLINEKAEKEGSAVVSVDIPSGINTDTGFVYSECVHAGITVTFTALKPGLLLPPGKMFCGEVLVRSIGITDVCDSYFKERECELFCFEDEKVTLKKRLPYGNKGTFHRIGVIAGSVKMSGAATLCAEAVLRSGAGLADVYTHSANREIIATTVPEAICHGYDDFTDFKSYEADLSKDDIIVIGPGLSTLDTAREIVGFILRTGFDKPLVIDADALNVISSFDELKNSLKEYALKNTVIITPHPAELSRLTKIPVGEILSDYPDTVRNFADSHHLIVVGKGNTTLVSDGKRVYFNLSGNDGMATAGSGDVLAGMIASFAVNEENPYAGTCLAVYAHGKAGDLAAGEFGHRGMIARNIIQSIKELERV